MDKVLVEVYIPASEKSYDVFLPLDSKLYEVVYLLASTMAELTQGEFSANPDTVLCDRNTGQMLNINLTVEENGVMNGTKLMLV
ncbi:EsaB/YukD family protein [Neobacillus sp. LXY-4]|uniref:EsaB/YukD family protein n=1 Tax=Neobacillus sp. LXY-4 TaxID=3379826 RepID=UPI003EE00976